MVLSQNDFPLFEADIPQLQKALVAALRSNNFPAVKALTVALSTIDLEEEWTAEVE